MSLETLPQDTPTMTGGDNNFDNPPPPEIYFPDGEGDDYFSIQEGINQLQEHANNAIKSVADGWEERARDTKPGRGYDFSELAGKRSAATSVAGRAAVAAAFWHDRRPYSTGMPSRPNPLGQFVSRRSIARY